MNAMAADRPIVELNLARNRGDTFIEVRVQAVRL